MTHRGFTRGPWEGFRHCPGCGSRRITVRGDRSVICARCGYHLYFNTASAVAALMEDDIGRLLMTVRAHDPGRGCLDLPGGFVDFEESAEQALVREVQEELNLTVTKCTYFRSFPNTYAYDGVTYHTLDLSFVCLVDSFTDQRLSDEIEEVRFLRPEDIDLNGIAFDSIRRIVSDYLRVDKAVLSRI